MTENTRELTESDRTMRMMLAAHLGGQIGGDKDLYDVVGWDKNPTVQDYYASYLRNPYAGPVVEAAPETCWRDPPRIEDNADKDNDTSFEKDVDELVREHRLWHYCKRLDILSGIGEYGVLVLELSDTESPDDFETEVSTDTDDGLELLGLRPFSQESVEDIKEGGPGSGRWGEPIKYKIDLSDEDDDVADENDGPNEIWVHHSRVVHLPSDGLLDDEIRGQPRQEAVWNPLTDIEKTLGSAAEIAYRASSYGLNINLDKDYSLEDGGDAMDEQVKRWYHNLEPILQTQGADVQNIGGEQIDPGPVIDPEVEAISARTKIPQSVLKGNETGERATTQDLKDWYGENQGRRNNHLTPALVREMLDRLIKYGVTDSPSDDGYEVDWPPLAEESEQEIADTQKARSTVIKNVKSMVPSLTTEHIVQYIEEGEFPDDIDTSNVEPGDLEQMMQDASGEQDQFTPSAVADN